MLGRLEPEAQTPIWFSYWKLVYFLVPIYKLPSDYENKLLRLPNFTVIYVLKYSVVVLNEGESS